MNVIVALPSLLAAVPDTPAGRAGYYFGIVLAVVVTLAVLIFGLVAIIMALTRRTTGWIIAGSIAGVGMLAFGALFVVGFVAGVKRGIEGKRSGSASMQAGSVQTITGKVLPFTIQIPVDWTIKRSQGVYDLVANNGGNFVSVIVEEVDLGSAANITQAARERIKEVASDVELSEPEPIQIDGREWLQFTVKCKVKLIPFAYQYYTYSGKEGSFQLIGWTFQNLWERQSATIRESMLSFRFPPETPTIEAAAKTK